jgi:hypothetical protein
MAEVDWFQRAVDAEEVLREAVAFERAKALSTFPNEVFPVPRFTPQWCVDALKLFDDLQNKTEST